MLFTLTTLYVILLVFSGWVLSVCLHEFGHAITAYCGGDTSVKDKGYLTLNPLKYIDPVGSILIPVILLLLGGIALPGGAVYIEQGRLRNRWWKSAVSAAGPIASGLVALLLAILLQFFVSLEKQPHSRTILTFGVVPALAFLIFLQAYAVLLNLLPIPPLDGYGIIEPWLPHKTQLQMRKFAKYGIAVLFILVLYVRPFSHFLARSARSMSEILGVSSFAIATGANLFAGPIGKALSVTLMLAAFGLFWLFRKFFRPHRLWYDQGNALLRSGRYEQAIASYDEAIRIKPDLHEAWLNRSAALEKLQRYKEVLTSANRAIQLKSDYPEAWYNRGLALQNLERDKEAVTAYKKVVQIQPAYYAAWYGLGFVLQRLQRYEEAVATYDEALRLSLDSHEAWYSRGVTLYQLQRYEEAVSSYDKASQIKPDHPEAWYNRGVALQNLQRHEEAIAFYDKAIELKPEDYGAWLGRGTALRDTERYEEAIASYNKAIQIEPKNHKAWLGRGIVLDKLQRYEEAATSYENVLQIKPDMFFVWNSRGVALAQSQRYEEAFASLNRAAQIDPNRPEAWYNKACCYALQGNIDLALENLQQAFGLDRNKLRELAKIDSSLESIREDERFKALIA